MSKPLSAKQLEAAQLLGRGVLHRETAKAINVTRQTLHRWSKRDDFQDAIAQVRNQLQAGMAQQSNTLEERLCSLLELSIDGIEEILKSTSTKPSDLIKAAALIGQWTSVGGFFTGDLMRKEQIDAFARDFIDLIKRTFDRHSITHLLPEILEELTMMRDIHGIQGDPPEGET